MLCLQSIKSLAFQLAFVLLLLSPSLAAIDEDTVFNGCRDKLIKAQQLDVLVDLEWNPPKAPKVVVGQTFFNIPFDAKEGLARTVNCFLVGGTTNHVNFSILEHMNHRIVGEWKNGKLKMK